MYNILLYNTGAGGALKSTMFIDFLNGHPHLVKHIRVVLDRMFLSDGLIFTVDKPFNKNPCLSHKRPAVFRQMFGDDRNDVLLESPFVWRCTYGTGSGISSVGTPKW